MIASPWWGPPLGSLLSTQVSALTRRRRSALEQPTDPDLQQDQSETLQQGKPSAADAEDEELRRLRDMLIDVLQELQAKTRQAEQLARDLDAKGAQAEAERSRAEQLARELAELRPEVMKLREQVDVLIGRRERTPPHGQPEVATDSMRRPEL